MAGRGREGSIVRFLQVLNKYLKAICCAIALRVASGEKKARAPFLPGLRAPEHIDNILKIDFSLSDLPFIRTLFSLIIQL